MQYKFLTLYKCLNCSCNFAEWQGRKPILPPKCRHCNTARPVIEMGTLQSKVIGTSNEIKNVPKHFKKETEITCPKCQSIIEPQVANKPWAPEYICDNCGYDLNEKKYTKDKT